MAATSELAAQQSQNVGHFETSQFSEISRQGARDGKKGRYDALTEDSEDYKTLNLNSDYREWNRLPVDGQTSPDSLIPQRKEARASSLEYLRFKPHTEPFHLVRPDIYDLEEGFVAALNPGHCPIQQNERFEDPCSEFYEQCHGQGGNMAVSKPTNQFSSAEPSNFNLYHGDSSLSNRQPRPPRGLFPAYERDFAMWDPSLPARPWPMMDNVVMEAINPQIPLVEPIRERELSFPVPHEESQPFPNQNMEASHLKSGFQEPEETVDNELDSAWAQLWAPIIEEYKRGLYAIKNLQEDNSNEWDNNEDKLNRSISSWLQATAEPEDLEMPEIEPLQEYEDNSVPQEYEESEELMQLKIDVIEGEESSDEEDFEYYD